MPWLSLDKVANCALTFKDTDKTRGHRPALDFDWIEP